MELKAYIIEDNNTKVVKLPRGVYKLGDDRVIEITNSLEEVVVNDFDNIRRLTVNRIVDRYESDRLSMSVDSYLDELKELQSKGEDDGYGNLSFSDLDDEYSYKKFKRTWTPIYKEVLSESDPLVIVSPLNIRVESGLPFITSKFSMGVSDSDLFVYNQAGAWLYFVEEKMKELGVEFVQGASYESTKSKLIWGNSTHSCIQYVTFGGTYIFSKLFVSPVNRTGSLANMKALWENDRNTIRDIIQRKYNVNFGRFDEEKGFIVAEQINKLGDLISIIRDMEVKQKSASSHSSIIKSANEIKRILEETFS